MKYAYTLKLSSLLIAFALFLTACGDDPASANEDPPEFPTFENFQPDLTYFDANIPNGSPANEANFYASSFAAMSQTGIGYSGFFSGADRDEASYNNGIWTWEYSYSEGGESISIVLESEERSTDTYWSMTWNYSGADGTVEDYTMLEGTVAHDGMSGSWTFNMLNEDTGEHYPMMTTTWNWSSETEGEIVYKSYDEDNVTQTYTYTQNGAEFTMTLTSQYEENDITIYWNEDTGAGYFQEGSTRTCWDSNFEQVTCS